MDVYENLKKAGIELPEKLAAAGLYKPVNQAGSLLFVSGQGSMDKGVHLTGRVGVDVTVDTSVQFNMMAGAFTGGQGDYVTLFEPTATQVEAAGQGYVLTSIGLESGEIPYTAYFANMSWLEKNADAAQRFVNAIAKAQKWVAGHTDRQVAEAICDQFPDTDLAELEAVTARHRQIDAWNATPVMERQALERLETVMEQAGELRHSDWVPFEELVNNTFAQNAIN